MADIMPIAPELAYAPVEDPAPEARPAPPWPPASAADRPLRLHLTSSVGDGVLDGAWWPHSRDLAKESVELVDHFPASFDRICRVVYTGTDWEKAPRRVRAADVFVNLASFPDDKSHRVLLKSRSAPHRARILQLLVVPPDWDDRSAREAMRIAATPSNRKSAAAILDESADQRRAGRPGDENEDGGTGSEA